MIAGNLNYRKPHDYCLVSIVEGSGQITVDGSDYSLNKGTHFILTTEDTEIKFNGDMTMIVSHV